MDIIEKIRAEVERLKKNVEQTTSEFGYHNDPHNRAEYTENDVRNAFIEGYQEALSAILSALQEKSEKPINHLANAGKMMEQPVCEGLESEDLEEAAENYAYGESDDKYQGFVEGASWHKKQMMKEAVEGEVCGRVYDHINVRFADGVCKYLEPKNISHIPADVSKYKPGDKVRIIIVKED